MTTTPATVPNNPESAQVPDENEAVKKSVLPRPPEDVRLEDQTYKHRDAWISADLGLKFREIEPVNNIPVFIVDGFPLPDFEDTLSLASAKEILKLQAQAVKIKSGGGLLNKLLGNRVDKTINDINPDSVSAFKEAAAGAGAMEIIYTCGLLPEEILELPLETQLNLDSTNPTLLQEGDFSSWVFLNEQKRAACERKEVFENIAVDNFNEAYQNGQLNRDAKPYNVVDYAGGGYRVMFTAFWKFMAQNFSDLQIEQILNQEEEAPIQIPEMYNFDISPEALEHGRKLANIFRIPSGKLHFYEKNLKRNPISEGNREEGTILKEGFFDFTISIGLMDYFEENDARAFIEKIRRYCAKGSRVAIANISSPDYVNNKNIRHPLSRILPKIGYHIPVDHDGRGFIHKVLGWRDMINRTFTEMVDLLFPIGESVEDPKIFGISSGIYNIATWKQKRPQVLAVAI